MMAIPDEFGDEMKPQKLAEESPAAKIGRQSLAMEKGSWLGHSWTRADNPEIGNLFGRQADQLKVPNALSFT